jgi:uncharacterized protein YktB (UPF0637 family)
MTTAVADWHKQELAIFFLEGFSARMEAIRALIQPKLRALGERLTPHIGRLARHPCYAHVAKHLRRTVNPPPETWVAFSPSPRGYKQFCHYAFVVSGGIHTRLVVNSEAPNRLVQAMRLQQAASELVKLTKALPLRVYEPWDYQSLPPLIEHQQSFWRNSAERLKLKRGDGFRFRVCSR